MSENNFLWGDEPLYEDIVKRTVYRLTRHNMHDENQIRGYVHSALLYFKRKIKTWKSDEHKINGVSQKAHSLFLDELRKQKPEFEIDLLDKGGTEMSESEAISRINPLDSTIAEPSGINPEYECERKELIEIALNAMTPQQRLIRKDTLEGYSPDEISIRHNLSRELVYKELQRGVEAAKRKLKP